MSTELKYNQAEVTFHAKEACAVRTMGAEWGEVPDALIYTAERKIRSLLEDPDTIYSKEPDKPPILIKGDIAVAFCPVEEDEQGYVVKTCYNSSTFLDKQEEGITE